MHNPTYLTSKIPPDWQEILREEFEKDYFKDLSAFVQEERQRETIFPPEDEVFSAFGLTAYDQVKVLLLGQDPYHGEGQAHGLAFSVCPGVSIPPSLVNIYRELKEDLDCSIPSHGSLISWAKQGVLLLNTVLTVRAHQANSHKKKGWEKFTDGVIQALNQRDRPLVFILWGNQAKKKAKWIDGKKHQIIQGVHPSPLSAHLGFRGSKPFSAVNKTLRDWGQEEIDWQIQ